MYQDSDMIEVLARLGLMAAAYDRSNPDVGMGPHPGMLLEDEVRRLRFPVPKEHVDAAIKMMVELERRWQ